LKGTIQQAEKQGITDYVKFANLLLENLKSATASYYGKKSYKTENDKQAKIKYELDKVRRVHEKAFLGKK
ncbi:MAG TPA: hypothetical protein VFD46_11580, partial [Chryseolinea sp.]|nr:hypothetical protein [Chryseolinea sp.]